MSYILNLTHLETVRLSDQDKLAYFDVSQELSGLDFSHLNSALDVGCGSGNLCSNLKSKYPAMEVSGIDIDEDRIQFASLNYDNIKFQRCNLLEENLPQKYDLISNRLFAHHFDTSTYTEILKKLRDALNPGGELLIIDIDGAFLNLGTAKMDLQEKISNLHESFHGDMEIVRKVPSLLKKLNFSEINYRIEQIDLRGEDRVTEAEQWRMRFKIGYDFYLKYFGNEVETKQFFKDYLEEFLDESVPVFYSKFIITAKI